MALVLAIDGEQWELWGMGNLEQAKEYLERAMGSGEPETFNVVLGGGKEAELEVNMANIRWAIIWEAESPPAASASL